MILSLVVATYNRAARLQPMLLSLLTQSADPAAWEVVVVNNNSTDDTLEVVGAFIAGHTNINMRVVTELRQGLSYARNCGIEATTAPLIAIIDDDEQICPSFVQSYIDFFDTHERVAAAGGAVIAKYDSARPEWLSPFVEIPIANPIAERDVARPFAKGKIPAGGNMAIRREAIERYGAFDTSLGRQGGESMGGEESNLFDRLRRAGEQVWFVPRAAIYHLIGAEKLEREYLCRLWYNIGRSQRRRAHIEGVAFGVVALREGVKWGVTLALALVYFVTLRPSKSRYLLLMRWHISRGLLEKLP